MNVLLVIHLLVAVALVLVILMQRTAQDGGGLVGGGGGGSTMGGLFTARGSANLLSRTTAILATIFIVLSLVLGMMASRSHEARSLADQINAIAPATQEQPAEQKAAPAEAEKTAPASEPQVPVSK